MSGDNYQFLEEKILTGQSKGYFFVSADKSKITYRVNGETYGFKNEKEKQRAYFLVEIIEKYGYQEKDIRLDEEVIINGNSRKFDLVVFQNKTPIFGVNFGDTIRREKRIFDIQNNCQEIPEFPQKN